MVGTIPIGPTREPSPIAADHLTILHVTAYYPRVPEVSRHDDARLTAVAIDLLKIFQGMPRQVPPPPARDLTMGQIRLLFLLRRGGPQPMGRIADVFDLSSTAATGFVARVERHGLVERHHRSDDRRIVECALTECRHAVPRRTVRRPARGRPDRAGGPHARGSWRASSASSATSTNARSTRHDRPAADLPPPVSGARSRSSSACSSIQAIATLYLPELNGEIINNGVAKGDTAYILSTGALMLGISAVVVAVSIVAVYWGSKTGMAFGRDVRGAIFRKVESFSRAELDTFGTASLITRNTNDVQQVQMVVLMGLNMMIIAPILAVGGIIMALRQDVPLSGILIVVLPLMALIVGLLMSRALPLFQAMQVKVDRVNQVTREALSGIRVIRAFVRTRHEEERFDVANRDLTATSLRVQRLFALMLPTLMLIFNLSTVAILWFGSIRVDERRDADRQPHRVPAVRHADPVRRDDGRLHVRDGPAGGRLVRPDPGGPAHDPLDRGPARTASAPRPATAPLAFRDVEFRYPGAQDAVLRDITLADRAGQTTAIVGSTGSGKTTLINLIPRFYDVTGGELDDRRHRRPRGPPRRPVGTHRAHPAEGVPVQRDDRQQPALRPAGRHRRRAVGRAPHRPGRRASCASWKAASRRRSRRAAPTCRAASASASPSPGRSSSAPRSTSSTTASPPSTSETDSLLRAALAREIADATVVIVAQRVGTIKNADRIVVLDGGTIAGIGTHAELMATCETYREIVYSQLSEEEAA